MQLTERDRQIIREVHRHRFLRSSHILSLVPGSAQQCLRRLKLLYHHRYLERPRSQLDYYHRGGSREMVYGLGEEGAALLNTEPDEASEEIRLGGNDGSMTRVFLEHALLVSDATVTIELACREAGIRFLGEDELAAEIQPSRKHELFEWKVTVQGGAKLTAAPDYVFALESTGADGKKERRYFFLEADRGTMPVIRKTLFQTSFYRKLLAYEATWSQQIPVKRFGFPRFRVVTVTTGPARVKSLLDACSKLERGHGLFLFADRSILEKPGEILSTPWKTGRSGETSTLLD
jgi:hypothetical protein